jgi:predicted dinucleotide-binding enzyme
LKLSFSAWTNSHIGGCASPQPLRSALGYAALISWNGCNLLDTTNIFLSYGPDFRIDDLKGDPGSEIIARLAPSARVVKAFNTMMNCGIQFTVGAHATTPP